MMVHSYLAERRDGYYSYSADPRDFIERYKDELALDRMFQERQNEVNGDWPRKWRGADVGGND